MIKWIIIWLAPRAGKMNQIARCDWLPERARWSHLARSGLPAVSKIAKFSQKPYNKSFIDQVCSVKMAGFWPRSFFASLWTSTSSRSINTQKKKKKLGQYPVILTEQTWSITHTYCNQTLFTIFIILFFTLPLVLCFYKIFSHPFLYIIRLRNYIFSFVKGYLTIRPVARKGFGSIAHEAKPNGLLTRGPWGRRV